MTLKVIRHDIWRLLADYLIIRMALLKLLKYTEDQELRLLKYTEDQELRLHWIGHTGRIVCLPAQGVLDGKSAHFVMLGGC